MKTTLVLLYLCCMAALAASESDAEFCKRVKSSLGEDQWSVRIPKDFTPSYGGYRDVSGMMENYNITYDEDYNEDYDEDYQSFNLPKYFDSREKWSHCKSIHTIWDQGDCGSCWAVNAAAAISDRICIHTEEQVMVSAEELMSCAKGGGCGGGATSNAWKYWLLDGVVSDTCLSYSKPDCLKKSCTPKCDKLFPGPDWYYDYDKFHTDEKTCKYDKYKAERVYPVVELSGWRIGPKQIRQREDTIRKEIIVYGPVTAYMDSYRDFLCYKAGVYEFSGIDPFDSKGHFVRLIGWGEERGVKYWLAANSWGENWGDQGIVKIKRGVNECGIESEVWAGIPEPLRGYP